MRLSWGSDRLGGNHTGKHTRPGLVFRADPELGAQSRAPWARNLAGLLTAEATMEKKDSLGGFSAGGIMWGRGEPLRKKKMKKKDG